MCSVVNDVASHDCRNCRIKRPYKDAQNTIGCEYAAIVNVCRKGSIQGFHSSLWAFAAKEKKQNGKAPHEIHHVIDDSSYIGHPPGGLIR